MDDVLWERYGTVGDYVVWKADDIFNITHGGEPGSNSGYYQIESLLQLKGLHIDDLVLDRPAVPGPAPRI
jgi:hypothetical protein